MTEAALACVADLARELLAADGASIALADGRVVSSGSPDSTAADEELSLPGPDGPLAVLRVHGVAAPLSPAARSTLDNLGVLVSAILDRERRDTGFTTLTHTLSHALKTPLTAVVGFTHLLSADPAVEGDPDLEEASRRIAASGHEVLLTVESVVHAIDPGEHHLESLSLPEVVSGALAELVPSGVEPPSVRRVDAATLHTQPDRLSLVLRLLLGELLAGAGDATALEVRCRPHDAGWRIDFVGRPEPLPDSLGLQVATLIARDLSGMLELSSAGDGGATLWVNAVPVPHN